MRLGQFGQLADRIGRRRVLIFCLGAFAAGNLLTAAAGNLAWLLAARLLAGAVAAGVSPSAYALVAGIAVAGFGISARTGSDDGTTQTARVMKAGKPVAITSSGASVVR